MLDVEALRRHYALTLRAWVRNIEEHWDEAVRLTLCRPGARVAAVHGVQRAGVRERGLTGVNQVLLQKPGGAEPPLRPRQWTAG